MAKTFRQLKSETDKNLQSYQCDFDENGKAIINMVVSDDTDFLSKFSHNSTPVVSQDLASFLENSATDIPKDNGLKLVVASSCIDDNEKVLYKKAIKETYSQKYLANEGELKKNFAITFLLAVLGILILAVAIYLEIKFSALIWAEVVDIVAWVLIWEAVDVLVFKSKEQREKRKLYLSLINMEIEYK